MKKRLFIVGCSRSGTTLLQVSVASHSQVKSFPETFFFKEATGRFGRPLARLGLATGEERRALRRVIQEINRPDLAEEIPRHPILYRTAAACFVHILDQVALEADKQAWVEKTPMHVHFVELIRRHVPKAHFIHIIRDGRDVVASIYDRAMTYPDKFEGQQDLSFGVKRWNQALAASLDQLGQPHHSFVLYDDLVAHAERVKAHIFEETGLLPNEPILPVEHQEAANDVVPDCRPWIKAAKKPPHPKPRKFDRLFTPEEKNWITKQLSLAEYKRLRAQIALPE